MPRYFFDVDNGAHTSDEDGLVLSTRRAVEAEAVETLYQVAQMPALDIAKGPITVTVRNEADATVYQATLSLDAGWTDA